MGEGGGRRAQRTHLALPTEAAVAEVPAGRAPPRVAHGARLVDVLAVAHEEAVAAELPSELAAPATAGVLAHRLLPTLMAATPSHGVVDAVSLGVVAVHEEGPGRGARAESVDVRGRVHLGIALGREELARQHFSSASSAAKGVGGGEDFVALAVIARGDTRQSRAAATHRGRRATLAVPAAAPVRVDVGAVTRGTRAGVARGEALGVGSVGDRSRRVEYSQLCHASLVGCDSSRALRFVGVGGARRAVVTDMLTVHDHLREARHRGGRIVRTLLSRRAARERASDVRCEGTRIERHDNNWRENIFCETSIVIAGHL